MRRNALDRIDRAILSDLQADGRMTNVELADRVGVSAPSCLRRVRTLEQAGLISGYHADLDGAKLGFSVTVFAQVGLSSQHDADLQAFRKSAWPEVRECYMLTGDADFLLKIVAPDWESYQAFLTTRLTAAPTVTHVKSALVYRTAKRLPGVPIDRTQR